MLPNTKLIKPVAYGATKAGETNDCTVRALSNASGLDYETAHKALQKQGRKPRKGATCNVWHRAYTAAGMQLTGAYGVTKATKALQRIYRVIPDKGATLSKIMPTLSQGRFIVIVTGHALAVVDGAIIDSHASSGNKSVVAVYKLIKDYYA